MSPEQLRQVDELFYATRKIAPEDRAKLLAAADAEVRQEVESLLTQHDRTVFGKTPPGPPPSDDEQTRSFVPPSLLLGQYRLESILGKGGMGTVWGAIDTKLNRQVAIKLLSDAVADAAGRRRFQREAQLASSLNHPHILTVYDAGESDGRQYLVTEFVDGGTLRDWRNAEERSWPKIVGLLTGVADGLAVAHAAGILHRDIKPANILVAKNGYAKLADFGLAKLAEPDHSGPTRSVAEEQTRPGTVLGTIGYMSPEQVLGKSLDARSDIFSFGAVLYEMLAGRRPFLANSDIQLLQAIVKEAPPPLAEDLPQALRNIVEKALEKDPAERYQSMKDMVVDLRKLTRQGQETAAPIRARRRQSWKWVVAAAVLAALTGGALLWRQEAADGLVPIRTIAVLPFQNYSGDASQEYFADGMTEALIADLAQVRALGVISRTSVMRYKGSTKLLSEIGKELGADGIVEASVQRIGNRVRITAQLIRASTDQHIWANHYERDLSDELKLEAEVAQEIVGEIRAQITPEQEAFLAGRPSVHPAAHEELLQGRYEFWKGNFESAAPHFQRAIQLQENFAEAYAALASVRAYQANSITTKAERLKIVAGALPLAVKAIELAPDLSDAHKARGDLGWEEMDWPTTEREYKRAFELNPYQLDVCGCYADLLAFLGRLPEAEAIIKQGAANNPLSSDIEWVYGLVKEFQRDFPSAVSHYQRAVDLSPNNPFFHSLLATAYLDMGKYQDALAALDRPELRESSMAAAVYAKAGRREEAEKILRTLLTTRHYFFRTEIAQIYFALGDKDHGFEWLTQAIDEQQFPVRYLKMAPAWDSIRSDSRYPPLVARLKIPDVP